MAKSTNETLDNSKAKLDALEEYIGVSRTLGAVE